MAADILILTIYSICVVYVLYQMALSLESKLEDQVEIQLDGDALQESTMSQLQQQRVYQARADIVTEDKAGSLLQLTFFNQEQPVGSVQLQVLPQGKKPLQPPMQDLTVKIVNQFPDQQVFVNWDNSSLAVHGGLAHRVIRKVPGMPIDLFQRQVMTVANPGQMVSVTVTSESLFNRPDNKSALESNPALVNFSLIPEMKDPMRAYSLRMLVWVRTMADTNMPAMQLLLPFNFRINVLPDRVALPILSWLLNFFSQSPKQRTP
ncbi:MAG: hypothetical protein AAGE59_15915 [Cyanobacteria bacterium P01_F01_bin.86]